MALELDGPDFQLCWPPDLLLSGLTAVADTTAADIAIGHVLEEAFVGSEPADRWRDAG